jgi:hypothetical protein
MVLEKPLVTNGAESGAGHPGEEDIGGIVLVSAPVPSCMRLMRVV